MSPHSPRYTEHDIESSPISFNSNPYSHTRQRSTSTTSTMSSRNHFYDKESHPLPQWLQGQMHTRHTLSLWIRRLVVAAVALVLLYTMIHAARLQTQELADANKRLAVYERGMERWLHPYARTDWDYDSSTTSSSLKSKTAHPPQQALQDTLNDSHIEKLAIMTFYSQSTSHDLSPSSDHYFQATRLLGYQLLHSPTTRLPTSSLLSRNRTIDFAVLVTPDVSTERRQILTNDGVKVIPVHPIHVPGEEWLLAGGAQAEWKDLMTKFRAWQQTQYSRVLFVDSDTVVMKPGIEGVFDDEGAVLKRRIEGVGRGEGELESVEVPEWYLLASLPETKPVHEWPPRFAGEEHLGIADENYICAGFFMFAPSQDMYNYLTSLIPLPHLYDPHLMEQSLLNYAHRRMYKPPRSESESTLSWISSRNEDDGSDSSSPSNSDNEHGSENDNDHDDEHHDNDRHDDHENENDEQNDDGPKPRYPPAHPTGPLPWTTLTNYRWNVRYPKLSDITGPHGAVTVHEKYWKAQMDWAVDESERITGVLSERKGEMEGWFASQRELERRVDRSPQVTSCGSMCMY